jgi:SAM-dependent methyltransferase
VSSDPQPPTAAGQVGVSEELRRFVEETPYERRSILDFVRGVAEGLAPGAKVIDVGAGNAPYRELFEHVDYSTVDWDNSPHERESDVSASADALPHDDESFDAVLLTQVLEHVPDPARVLAELYRILRPGGTVHITVPLVWELHELPYDYYRYTPASLTTLMEAAGFGDVEVAARNDCFTTIAQLLLNARHVMGRAPDGLDERREQVAAALADLSGEIAGLAPLDAQWQLPLGYAASGTRPPAP